MSMASTIHHQNQCCLRFILDKIPSGGGSLVGMLRSPWKKGRHVSLVIFLLLSQHNIRLSQMCFAHSSMCTEINPTFSLFCRKCKAHKQAEYCLHEDLQSFQLSKEVEEKCHGKQLKIKKEICIVIDCRYLVYRACLPAVQSHKQDWVSVWH